MIRLWSGPVLMACYFLFIVPPGEAAEEEHSVGGENVLRYRTPAREWESQALPIGNGRLGGMIFGGIDREHIQFNEDSLWIGDEHDTGAYQAFGDLYVEFGDDAGVVGASNPSEHPSSRGQGVEKTVAAFAQSYERTLDIGRALHKIRYTRDGTTCRRTYFCSHPAQVMVLRFTADKPAAYSGRVALADAHQAKITAEGNKITAAGSLAGYVYSNGSSRGRAEKYDLALDYEAQLLVLNEGGTLEARDGRITFKGCDALTLLLAGGTDYQNQRENGWKGKHPHERISSLLAAASGNSFEALLDEHVRDYQGLFDRLRLDLGETPEATRSLPTGQRLAAYRQGTADPDLEELLFQHARYMMISSSRPGALPANLQGLWNMSNSPPWRCDYHTDVNVEMNYWFVDPANLSECFEPLGEWLYSIRGVRRDETREAFGTRGWITHAENGIFGGSTWKWSKGDAAWVAQNLWDHYAFTQDKEYLRTRAYPVMKDLCEFWEDHLKELPDGTLVSPNGFSPEHGPEEDGVSFDQQLAWDLFTNYIEASQALGVDEPFRNKVASMRQRLWGPRIGRWGQLQEWMVDRDDPKDRHRHLSHMIAVYPGRQISPLTTPELAEAAKVSMNARGNESTGWSRAWKIAIWARLHDGNRTYSILQGMLQSMIHDNLFNTHPPFQIDGNFGYAAGVCEMLVQSHVGVIELLPALPDAWPTGRVRGIRARGGLEIDLAWKDGRATAAVLKAAVDGRCTLRAPEGQQIDGLDTLTLKAGKPYEVRFK
ncbi:MAG: glycoside hydrolase family 95 protein [Planctomycetes bacterium]|nr:glycoside hydrolase family 95 protein [Planctomycetota bacterium]